MVHLTEQQVIAAKLGTRGGCACKPCACKDCKC